MTKGKAPLRARNARKTGAPKRAAERIRESARDLFYRQGIRAVGVDEIVTRAGVTKPSLYRSFTSKDELVADYLRMMGEEGLARFDTTMAADPSDPRGCFRKWLVDLLAKANKPDYRGCGTTNAAVEYPDKRHPARKVSSSIKTRFRAKLRDAAAAMGARKPDELGDALMLLLEGVYSSGQLFGEGGPARVVIDAADAVIDRFLK
ncbi:MAG: TetR/AcrR family transcriptional regulator [Rhizomicrobium sp.]